MELANSKDDSDPIPGACIGLFTETAHNLIASTTADKNGEFTIKQARKGRYRLIVRDPQNAFCVANVPIEIADRSKGGVIKNRYLVVQLRAAGIDTCSYADLK